MTVIEIDYIRILCKAISRTKEINKYQGKSYSASGGSEAMWKGMVQPPDMEISLGVNYYEYVHITIKPNGDIFLSESALSDSVIKIDSPENEDQIVEKAFKLLDEISAKKENPKDQLSRQSRQ